MAHIVEFSIKGLAGRKKIYSQKLNRDINIFFGLNGSGKTSLLKILHSALDGDTSILKNVPFEEAYVTIHSIQYERNFKYKINRRSSSNALVDQDQLLVDEDSGRLELIGNRPEMTMRTYRESSSKTRTEWVQITKSAVKGATGWQHRYLSTSRLLIGERAAADHYSYRVLRDQGLSEDSLDRLFADTLQQLWSSYSAEMLKSVRQAQQEGLVNILQAVLTSRHIRRRDTATDPQLAYQLVTQFLERQGSPDILSGYDDFKDQYEKKAELRSVVGDINEVEEKIKKALAPRDKLQSLITEMFSGNKRLLFNDTSVDVESSDNEKLNPGLLSSGEKHLLLILIETLLAGDNTILVDEPEISMHVDWQKQLVSAMRVLSPNTQLILATHSPEIMADIEDNNIFRL